MQNHVRTIFSGGGGARLLTAFIAAVLLEASAGTAAAQSVSFSVTRATVQEDAPAAERLKVTVTRSGDVGTVMLVSNPAFDAFASGTASIQAAPANRTTRLNIKVSAEPPLTGSQPTPTINFDQRTNQAVLTIWQDDDGRVRSGVGGRNFIDEKAIFALRAAAGATIGPDLNLTFDDKHLQPTVEFSKTSMRLTEDSVGDAKFLLRLEDGSLFPRGGSGGNRPVLGSFIDNSAPNGPHRLRIKVEPPDGIGAWSVSAGALQKGPVEFRVNGFGVGPGAAINQIIAVDGMPGVFSLPTPVAYLVDTNSSRNAYENFTVQAVADQAGFRNPMVKITLQELKLERTVNNFIYQGILKASPKPLMIEVISDEAIPTVSFSPTDISIKEGGRTTAALISEGAQGAEVNTVKLAVDGDALVDLHKGDAKLEPKDGVITVDLKDTNLARLTARSMSDRSLLDGQMKKKTWRIADADGANIDADANSFTVTVEGSTAVPALPLLAQFLLALFLAAGGARLYRRR